MDIKQYKEVKNDTTITKRQSTINNALELDDLAELDQLMDGFHENATVLQNEGKGKGKGKAMGHMQAIAGGKDGKGKGKGGKGKSGLLAIKNEGDDEGEASNNEDSKQAELDTAYAKCKSMQLLLTKTKMNIEEMLPSFKRNPCANKHIMDMISANMKALDDQIKKIKGLIVSKKAGIDHIKTSLTAAAAVIKETQQWMSKIRLLDAASTTSKAKKSKAM